MLRIGKIAGMPAAVALAQSGLSREQHLPDFILSWPIERHRVALFFRKHDVWNGAGHRALDKQERGLVRESRADWRGGICLVHAAGAGGRATIRQGKVQPRLRNKLLGSRSFRRRHAALVAPTKDGETDRA